tara:strand:+ start:233 stop:355 length:123 start_codon:yes stop_codon:yes gene_type:complete
MRFSIAFLAAAAATQALLDPMPTAAELPGLLVNVSRIKGY